MFGSSSQVVPVVGPQPGLLVRIDLVRVLELLRTTATLCQIVFLTVRTTERQRRWMLTGTCPDPARCDPPRPARPEPGARRDTPLLEATPEALFQRCRDLRAAFFAKVLARFTARLLGVVPGWYAADLAGLQARLATICVVHGSRLAAMAQLLWAEQGVVLPGCLLAV